MTYFVGENGSGKSTLIEAIAVAANFNPEGGSKGLRFETNSNHSSLADKLQLVRGIKREKDGFFLRAESFYNVASQIQLMAEDPEASDPAYARAIYDSYGGQSLHERSHGESFMALFQHRFKRCGGLYILDEPEAALSLSRQFAFLHMLDTHVHTLTSQFIISTHSPVLLGYPDSIIYELGEQGIRRVDYEDVESVKLTLDFLNNREVYLRQLAPHLPAKGDSIIPFQVVTVLQSSSAATNPRHRRVIHMNTLRANCRTA